MRVPKLFRFRSDRPSVIIAALMIGVVLSVAGSVLATSIGDSVSVTTTLSVTGTSALTGNTGIGTSTPGSLFSIHDVGNFNKGTSTLYASLLLPNFSATSTLATTTVSTGGFNVGLGQFVVQQNSGRVGVGTSTPGSLFSIHDVGNFNKGTSTLYASLLLPNFSATSTLATSTISTGGFNIGLGQFVVQQNSGNVGIGSSTPGSLFSIHDVGNFNIGTSTLYASLLLPNFSATSTLATTTVSTGGFNVGLGQFVVQQNSGRVGVGTSTPGSVVGIQGVANFIGTSDATSTIYTKIQLPSFQATSTVATSSFSNGLLIGTSEGAVGIGTTTPLEKFSLAGNALIGAGANGTSTLVVNSSGAGVGSCIQMRAASSSDMYRIYIGKTADATGSTTGLMVERGLCR